ncbi:MAG: lipoyl protein ligase domain-containing protein [Opitutales bacterium]
MFLTLPNAFGDAATNMAIDAALLDTLPEACVAFRHYGWTEPAITFGYSQRYQEVKAASPEGITLCRRMTGGGIVDHRNDWTYALIIQRTANCADLSSNELYARVHQALAQALAALQTETRLAPCPRQCGAAPASKSSGPSQCFVQPVMNDVLHPDGRKIAGAAMKRTRNGLLLQGSVDRAALPEALDFQSFPEHFIHTLTQSLTLTRHQPEDLRPYFNSERIERERSKFASAPWTQRR